METPMTPRFIPVLMLAALASSAALFASPARAANPDAAKAGGSDADKPDAAKSDALASAGAADAKTADPQAAGTPIADAEAGSSPIEETGKTYRSVGLRYRAVIVPKFMMNLFGDGGRTVLANGFGPEFGIRKDAFEYDFAAWYTSYAMDPTPFKASSDGADAWEIVESHVKVLFLTADFLWSHDIVPEFSVNYGLGAGFGFVWGDLKRTQAYPGPGANDSTGAGYKACNGVGDPNPGSGGNDNNHTLATPNRAGPAVARSPSSFRGSCCKR